MTGNSQPPAHFERLYGASPDPWNLAGSDYERQKYEATLATLGDRRFRNAFEPGCSIGVLTEKLAPRCAALLAADFIPAALDAARARCAPYPHVRIAPMHVPADWPAQSFDLIVLSELLYFLNAEDLDRIAARTLATIRPGGLVLLVNYTGPTDDPTTGNQAATHFITATSSHLHLTSHQRATRYRIDLLQARGG